MNEEQEQEPTNEVKPIHKAMINDIDRDKLILVWSAGGVVLRAESGDRVVVLGFHSSQTPKVIRVLKSLMKAIERDGGTVER